MRAIAALECRRLALQDALDRDRIAGERNRLGQFATPPALAAAVVCTALSHVGPDDPVRFLDPAFGTGAFLSALLAALPSDRLDSLAGFEIDPRYGMPARALWQPSGLALTLDDFTRATPPEPAKRATLLVCNPPYVRHHHIAAADKPRLQALGETVSGVRLSGLAGLYAHFMMLAHAHAADGAIAAWLVPAEFMDVNYGAGVRRYLSERVTLLRLHRFDPAEVQFNDALVSSAVLWWRHLPPPPGHIVDFTRGGSIAMPAHSEAVPLARLAAEGKWNRWNRPGTAPPTNRGGRTLGDLVTIRRGVATGDNRFFIMTVEEAESRGLPAEMLRPILPGPRRLPPGLLEIDADADGAPRLTPRLMLLDCRLAETEVAERFPSLWRYLHSGAERVGSRYLCRHRTPWYAQEQREPPPLLCTYMGRGNSPFRFIRNHSRATAPNVYLLMYPRPELSGNPGRLEALWHALNGLDKADLAAGGRVYGGGLHKLEPRELARLPVDRL
ncbi:MAG: hypothetical protein WCF85_09970 [Rhodospirillaceae bacterium]